MVPASSNTSGSLLLAPSPRLALAPFSWDLLFQVWGLQAFSRLGLVETTVPCEFGWLGRQPAAHSSFLPTLPHLALGRHQSSPSEREMGLFLALWGEANALLLFKNTWCALCKQGAGPAQSLCCWALGLLPRSPNPLGLCSLHSQPGRITIVFSLLVTGPLPGSREHDLN